MSASNVGSSSGDYPKYPLPSSSSTRQPSSQATRVKKTSQGRIKSHKSESQSPKSRKITLKRTASVNGIEKYEEKSQDIKKKCGQLWDCIDRLPHKSGGFLYSFRLKEPFRTDPNAPFSATMQQKIKRQEISPADEPDHERLIKLLTITDNIEEYAQKNAAVRLAGLKEELLGSLNIPKEMLQELAEYKFYAVKMGIEEQSKELDAIFDQIQNELFEYFDNEMSYENGAKLAGLIDKLQPYFVREELRKSVEDPNYLVSFQEDLSDAKLLRKIGYKYAYDPRYEDYILTIPDRVVHESRFVSLSSKLPALSDINFVEAKGKSTDRVFIEDLLMYDVAISQDEEFLHDTTVHLARTIRMINKLSFSNPPVSYKEVKDRIKKVGMEMYQILLALRHQVKGVSREGIDMQKIKMYETALAYFLDGASAIADYSVISDRSNDDLKKLDFAEPFNYIRAIFGEETLTLDNLEAVDAEWVATVQRVSKALKAVASEIKNQRQSES